MMMAIWATALHDMFHLCLKDDSCEAMQVGDEGDGDWDEYIVEFVPGGGIHGLVSGRWKRSIRIDLLGARLNSKGTDCDNIQVMSGKLWKAFFANKPLLCLHKIAFDKGMEKDEAEHQLHRNGKK